MTSVDNELEFSSKTEGMLFFFPFFKNENTKRMSFKVNEFLRFFLQL